MIINCDKKAIRIGIFSILTGLLLTSVVSNAQADETYDVPGSINASDILPPNLISNEHFTVREEVTWFDGLYQFTVDTEYGPFEIWGEPMLRVRLHEFIAWNRLNNISAANVGAQAVGRTAFQSVSDLLMAFSHPITTIQGLPRGISRLFKEIGRDIEAVTEFVSGKESEESPGKLERHGDDDTNTTTETAEIMVGVNSAYRRWAEKAGVNPYTTNLALKEELNRVATIDAYISSGTWLIVPGISRDMGIVATVSRSIYEQDWHEIVEGNRKSLRDAGVEDRQIEKFLGHDFVNLALSTLLIETLNKLDGVEDKALIVDQVILLETEAEAI